MKLIAGLGNPGVQYETTRHNAGFLAIDHLVDQWKAVGPKTKNQAEIFEARFSQEKTLLVKPHTYMNRSGVALSNLFQFFKLNPEDLIVIHDDLDLEPGAMRIKKGGGTAGHNGLKSINESLGKSNTRYYRIRIGVGKPSKESKISPVDYVLKPFSQEEIRKLEPVLDDVVTACELVLKGQANQAMTRFNQRTQSESQNKKEQ